MVLPNGPLIRSRLPRPGSIGGIQKWYEFVSRVLDICGQTETLFVPQLTDTTTSTDASRNARVYTHDATIASRLVTQASGVGVTFNGTSGEADTPDVNGLSFGDFFIDS